MKNEIVKVMLNQKGFAPILLVIGIVILVGLIAGTVYLKTNQDKQAILNGYSINQQATYSPEEVINQASKLNGKQIEIKGNFSGIDARDSLDGMPILGMVGFPTHKGDIVVQGVDYNKLLPLAKDGEISIKGIFESKNPYSSSRTKFDEPILGVLEVPVKCTDCVSSDKSEPTYTEIGPPTHIDTRKLPPATSSGEFHEGL